MNLVLTLLHAGRETTAGHISWAIVDLLRHPDELDKVRAEIDGVRVRTPDGWWLLRASNTQAIVVVRAESSSEAGLQRLKEALAKELAASRLTLPDA